MKEEEQTKQLNIDAPWLFLAGPFFLLCTLAISAPPSFQEHVYLLSAALIGMALCAYFRIRGFIYALLFFGLAAAINHGFFTTDHLWQFGLEGSLACGLLVTALTLDQRRSMVESLQEGSKTREMTILHLEEDLAKLMEFSQLQQISLQEKLTEKQKELEELQTECSSILTLNEVLRKTTARQTEESEQMAEKTLDKERQIGSLLAEIDDLQKELARVSNLSDLGRENGLLQKAINSVRVDKAQMDLKNEELALLYDKEARKVREISDRFEAIQVEKQKIQEDLRASKAEIGFLSTQVQHMSAEMEKSLACLKESEKLQMEKTFLQERLHAAEAELAAFAQKMDVMGQKASDQEQSSFQAEREVLLEKWAEKESYFSQIEEKLKNSAQIEALYKQLKIQFEEKNEILHETRAKLFQAETQLQRVLMEKEQLALQSEPIPPDLQKEILDLEKQVSDMQQENDQLQQIITHLSNGEHPSQGKKN